MRKSATGISVGKHSKGLKWVIEKKPGDSETGEGVGK